MTHEERATWFRRGFVLFVAICVVVAVLLYPSKKPAATNDSAKTVEATHDLEIIHFHLPKNAESETMADYLTKVEKKYNGQVLVTRVDIAAEPERAKAEKVTKPPKVVMMVGTVRACKFQGLWTQVQIERKVEEILRGLKRMGKDWRPDVSGMQAAQEAPKIPSFGNKPANAPTPAGTPAPPGIPATPGAPAASPQPAAQPGLPPGMQSGKPLTVPPASKKP